MKFLSIWHCSWVTIDCQVTTCDYLGDHMLPYTCLRLGVSLASPKINVNIQNRPLLNVAFSGQLYKTEIVSGWVIKNKCFIVLQIFLRILERPQRCIITEFHRYGCMTIFCAFFHNQTPMLACATWRRFFWLGSLFGFVF